MTHPENLTPIGRFLRQTVEVKQQCFILAESITDEAIQRRSVIGEARDSYLANIPNMAATMMNIFTQIANMSLQANPREIDRGCDAGDDLLKELRAFNKERDS